MQNKKEQINEINLKSLLIQPDKNVIKSFMLLIKYNKQKL